MTDDRASRARSLVLVVLVLASVLSPTLVAVAPAAAASSTSSAPSGMVGVPSENLADIRPSDVEKNISAADLDGAVYVSEHASTTTVSIVTRAQAAKVARGASPADVANERVCSSPASTPLNCERDTTTSLVISDDVHDEGRRIAIDVEVVRDALGYVPEHVAVANNETGETWRAPATVKNGYLIADLAHFSSNSVSFEGTVNVTASPASNSTSVSYNLSDLDGASDPVLNLTGVTNTQWDNESATNQAPGSSSSVSIAGSEAPSGNSANGNPVLEITGKEVVNDHGDPYSYSTRDTWQTIGGDSGNGRAEFTFRNEPASVSEFTYTISTQSYDNDGDGAYTATVDIYLVKEKADGTYGEGTKIKDNYALGGEGGGNNETISFSPTSVSGPWTIEFVTVGTSGDLVRADIDKVTDDGVVDFSEGGTVSSNYASRAWVSSGTPSSVSFSASDGTSASLGNFADGETKTAEFNISKSASSVSVDASGGVFDYTVHLQERTKTVDPGVLLNGNKYAHSGTLNDGETVSLTLNSSDLKEGTNYVNATVGDGTLSADAPAPKFEFTYEHDAKSTYKVDYSDEKLTVRYEVGKNYSSDQNDVTMKIPFENNVYEMRDVQKQTNGNGWSSVSSSNYRIDSGTLYVDVGDVKSGDVVEVRANGSRVRTTNMTIEVVEPTAAGDDLDSKIKITSIGSDASMTVSASGTTDFIRYTSKESWSNPKEKVRVHSDGKQTLYLPNAASGSTFRLNDHETKVKVETNEVDIRFEDSGVEPKIRVMPGPHEGDPMTLVYTLTTSGETYILFSKTHEIQRDSDEANSPAYLKDDDSLETLSIFEDDSSTSSSSGSSDSSVSSVIAGAKETTPDLPPFGYVLLAIVVTIGVYFLSQRTPGEGQTLLYVVIPPVWLVALELSGIPVISVPVQAAAGGLERVFPALALLFGGLAAYGIYVRYIKDAAKPDSVTNVSFNLRGKKK